MWDSDQSPGQCLYKSLNIKNVFSDWLGSQRRSPIQIPNLRISRFYYVGFRTGTFLEILQHCAEVAEMWEKVISYLPACLPAVFLPGRGTIWHIRNEGSYTLCMLDLYICYMYFLKSHILANKSKLFVTFVRHWDANLAK